MVWFILCIILVGIGVGMLVKGKFTLDEGRSSESSYSLRGWSLIPFGIAFIFFLLSVVRVVSPGEVGVPVTFGSAGDAKGSGVHFVLPWTDMKTVSVRSEEYTMSHSSKEGAQSGDDSVPVNTKDQVSVDVDSTVIYRVPEGKAKDIYVKLGTDYVDKVVRPSIREAIRSEAVDYDATELATSGRADYASQAQNRIEKALVKYGIVVQDLKLRDIGLPKTLRNAVDAKVAAQQAAIQQQFELQKKQQEAEQRRVEAQGLADAQAIIRSTLTPEYLSYEYIQTLQKLAGSPNTTFLFVPNDPSGLPSFVLPPGSTK